MVASTVQRIAKLDIVVIIRETDPETATETVDALRRDGVSTIEITANTENVFNIIWGVSESFTADGVTAGVGTAFDTRTTWATTLASAEFIITPSFDEGIVETVNRYGVPSLVGIVTSTEAVNAFEADAGMVKVFSAGMSGPRFIPALDGPLGCIPAVSTGGVGLNSVDEFFDVGVTAVGVGNFVIDTEVTACGEFGVIEANAHMFREAIETIRSG